MALLFKDLVPTGRGYGTWCRSDDDLHSVWLTQADFANEGPCLLNHTFNLYICYFLCLYLYRFGSCAFLFWISHNHIMSWSLTRSFSLLPSKKS